MGKETSINKMPAVSSILVVDCVITDFYRRDPLIGLITRKKPPFQDKFCLPGGHFDAGVWDDEDECFVASKERGCDSTFEAVASRELQEEVGLSVEPSEWQFIMHLTFPDRDPRHDQRRISAVFWKDLHSRSALELGKAGSDAAKWGVYQLLSLKAKDMGFDHWQVIQWLQKEWRKLENQWYWDGHKYLHRCHDQYKDFGIIYRHDSVSRTFYEDHSVRQPIKFCPVCGLDLQLPVIITNK